MSMRTYAMALPGRTWSGCAPPPDEGGDGEGGAASDDECATEKATPQQVSPGTSGAQRPARRTGRRRRAAGPCGWAGVGVGVVMSGVPPGGAVMTGTP